MTFDQYIYNPMGKGSVAMTAAQRDAWKERYNKKFGEINLREAGNIRYHLYWDRSKNIYVAHILIPSEVVKDFYYDTVIEFTGTDMLSVEATLNNYSVRFYSNDPSFVFTYLKVFKDNEMFIDWLKNKSPKQALRKDPKQTNPYKIPGYVKSIYFAYILMKNKGLFLKKNYELYGSKFSKKELDRIIMHADKKIELRIQKGKEVEEEKRKQKAKEKKEKIANANQSRSSANKNKLSRIVKNSPLVKTTKQSKAVKRTSKISKK